MKTLMIRVINCGILAIFIFTNCKTLTIPFGEDIVTGKIIVETNGGRNFQTELDADDLFTIAIQDSNFTVLIGDNIISSRDIKSIRIHQVKMTLNGFKKLSPLLERGRFGKIKMTTTRNTHYKFKLTELEVTENELVYLVDEENKLIIPSSYIDVLKTGRLIIHY